MEDNFYDKKSLYQIEAKFL